MESIEDRLRQIIAGIAKITPESMLPEDDLVVKYGVDSMRSIEIVIEIEKTFGITISDEEAGNPRTFANFLNLVEKHKGVNK